MPEIKRKKQRIKNRDGNIKQFITGQAAITGGSLLPVIHNKTTGRQFAIGMMSDASPKKGMPAATDKVTEVFKKKHGITNVKSYNIPKEMMSSSARMPRFEHKTLLSPAAAHFRKKGPLEVGLHELGHAANYKKLPKLKKVLRIGSAGLGLGALPFMMTSEDHRKYAPAVAAASFAPTLIDEAIASSKALKFMKQHYKKPVVSSARKYLTKAFATYGLRAAGVTGATALAVKYLNRNKNNASKK